MERPTKYEYLMAVANLTSQMSTCSRLQVGAVLSTIDLTQFVVGYNGGAKGGPNACLRDEPGNCGCVHAEMNAVAKATKGIHVVAFLTHSPCEMCATLLINAGIILVYYQHEYRDSAGIDLLRSILNARMFGDSRGIRRTGEIDPRKHNVQRMEPSKSLEVMCSVQL
jgi:dCMP deaminase